MQFGMLFNVLLEVLVTARPSAVEVLGGAGTQSSACVFPIWGLGRCFDFPGAEVGAIGRRGEAQEPLS